MNSGPVHNSAFLQRQPSAEWELVRCPDSPAHFFWVWFKPQHAPHSLVIKLPAELSHHPAITQINLHVILQHAGLAATEFSGVSIGGVTQDAAMGQSPIFQQPISNGLLNGSEIHLFAAMPSQTMYAQPAAPVPHQTPLPPQNAPVAPTNRAAMLNSDSHRLYSRIDADWQSILQMERQLATLRKTLAAAQSRVDGLNRNLRPDETRHADRQDVSDWQDARRWLRDCSSKLSRFIKEYDIGVTSVAGKRKWFEEAYNMYVVPRQPWDQLQSAQREFETHRKIMTTLVNNMTNAQASAGQDGENRAKQILARIRAKSSRRK